MLFNARNFITQGSETPVIAFFGLKGGVGKTTISNRFAELVTLSSRAPNVLIIDLDVNQPGTTITYTKNIFWDPATQPTIHDYISSRHKEIIAAIDITSQVKSNKDSKSNGRYYLVPASTQETKEVWKNVADISYEELLSILDGLIKSAISKYNISCVVIDCGPIIDPYTAAAAHLSDRAFVIGQNEDISFANFKSYAQKLQEFYPIATTKVKLIINKVKNWNELQRRKIESTTDVFKAIPLTMDIIDISEGINGIKEISTALFDCHINEIVEGVFGQEHPDLVPPKVHVLPPGWENLSKYKDYLGKLPRIKQLGWARILLPFGISLICAGFAANYVFKIIGVGDANLAGSFIRSIQNITILLAGTGILSAFLGIAALRSRNMYLQVINGIHSDGVDWLLKAFQENSQYRKTIDNVGKMLKIYLKKEAVL